MTSNFSQEEILKIIRYNDACREVQSAKLLWWLENVYIPRLVKKEVKQKGVKPK